MTKIIASWLLLMMVSTGFAANIIFNNETTYPLQNQKSKIAIQWATSAKDMQKGNKALIYGLTLDQNSLKVLNQSGKINVNVPAHAEYFRVLVWSKGVKEPDLLTSWVSVEPNKIYTVQKDQLVPAVLMSGTGC